MHRVLFARHGHPSQLPNMLARDIKFRPPCKSGRYWLVTVGVLPDENGTRPLTKGEPNDRYMSSSPPRPVWSAEFCPLFLVSSCWP